MDPAQLWQRYQEWLYHHEGLGLFLDISRIRFDSGLVESLRSKFVSAFSDMQALEAGAIANPDEHRQVGHYWLRAPHLAPRAEVAQAIKTSLEQIKSFADQVHTGRIQAPNGRPFTQLLWIGIGGSALGPQFVSQALTTSHPPLRIHFIDNTDPDGIDQVLTGLQGKLDQTLVAVVSKSGGTPEPNNGMVEIQAVFKRVGLDFPRQAIAITGPGSQLEQRAHDWLACFPIFEWVGGRTSELSAVGLVPAALQQIDIEALLAGAAEMDEATRLPEIQSNPAALLALAWYAAGEGRGRKDMVILPYKDRLMLLSRYLQQLVMESLGKALDLSGQRVEQGIAVYGNKGSTDQHAYVQQLRDGVNNFFVTFIEVLEDRQGDSPELEPGITAGDYLSGFLQGTRQALFENQRDSITLTLPRVDPRRVGALIALYERAVGLYASLIHINAYHQPGVEAGKRAAASILDLQRQMIQLLHQRKQSLTLQELATALDQGQQVETLYLLIRHLHANHRHIQVQGDWGQPSTLKISARP